MNIDEMNESTEPNENVKRKRFSLDYVYMFFIAAAMILCLVAASGFFIAAGWIGIKEFATIVVEKADYDAVAHISAGVITDKEIINGHTKSSGGMIYYNGQAGYSFNANKTYVPTVYRIHISADFEYNGETYQGNNYFDVSEDIYNSYNIGDYFDSENLLSCSNED